MTTWAGRGVVVALALAVGSVVLTGCTESADEARTVQQHLGQIDGVDHVEVTAPSWERGAALAITYEDVDDAEGLAALIADVDEVAVDQDYAPYRLTLTPSGDADHVLTVDASFAGSDDETAALDAWLEVGAAMIGRLDLAVEAGAETLAVDSGGGIAHDVAEARRIGYGGPTTRWTFSNGDTSFVVAGAVTSADVALLADVQGDVGPSGWQLGRYDGHARLDVDVPVDGVSSPAGLTAEAYGRRVEPIATAALDALQATGLPSFLSLRDPGTGDDRTDVFATWTSTQPPAPGRDRLGRGWDAWLEKLAG